MKVAATVFAVGTCIGAAIVSIITENWIYCAGWWAGFGIGAVGLNLAGATAIV